MVLDVSTHNFKNADVRASGWCVLIPAAKFGLMSESGNRVERYEWPVSRRSPRQKGIGHPTGHSDGYCYLAGGNAQGNPGRCSSRDPFLCLCKITQHLRHSYILSMPVQKSPICLTTSNTFARNEPTPEPIHRKTSPRCRRRRRSDRRGAGRSAASRPRPGTCCTGAGCAPPSSAWRACQLGRP